MKKRLLLGTVFCSLIVFLISCKHEIGVGHGTDAPVVEAKGSISGTVRYSNTEKNQNRGILITLDRTDGLKTSAVTKSVTSRSIVNPARSVISSTYTSDDGSYSFDYLEPGTYTIYASSSSSKEKAVCRNAVVRSSEKTIVETLNLTATGSITGTITTDFNYWGNTGFLVFIAGTSYMAMTDDGGNYTISDVPAGEYYQVVAMKNGLTRNLSSYVKVSANDFTYIGTKNFNSDELKSGIGSKGEQGIQGEQGEPGIQGEKGEPGEQGIQGEKGNDGIGIVWRGAFDSSEQIENPTYLDAYFNMTDGCSYIYNGKEWTLLAKAGKDGSSVGNASGSRNVLAIGTISNTEETTNQPVEITVNLTKLSLLKKGYVYSQTKPAFTDANAVLDSTNFVDITKDSDGKYKITATENGFYTIAAKDNEDFVYFTQEEISNIDKIAPGVVTGLRARYDIDRQIITVTWTNPNDLDFAYVNMSYKKGAVVQLENVHLTSESYSISNVRIDGTSYEFSIFSVDVVGNKSEIVKVYITPKGYSVGDVLLRDGTVVPYSTNTTFNSYQKNNAVGVCYDIDSYGKPKGWLGIYNPGNEELVWGYSTIDFTDIQCSTTTFNASTTTFIGDTDGSDNWDYICSKDSRGVYWGNYEAFDYVKNYSSTYGLTGEYSTGWYMPSIAELCYIYRNKEILNSILVAIGGTTLSGKYWSSSQDDSRRAWGVYFDSGSLIAYTKNEVLGWGSVCCIRKFKSFN